MNLEENKSSQLPDGRPISRWREFGLQKGVLSHLTNGKEKIWKYI